MHSEQSLGTISINVECNIDPQNPGSITEGINNVLNGFNTQLLIVLGSLHKQKRSKGKELKSKLVKLLFKDNSPSKRPYRTNKGLFGEDSENSKRIRKTYSFSFW